MKKSGVLKYILVVVAAVVVVLAVRFFGGGKEVSYTLPRPAVTVAYPVRGTMTESLTLNGHVEARSMIPVIPLVSGTILDYPARSGESVVAGELLAQIDPEPFRQQMLQAQAAYTGYESSFRRVEGLYQAGAATRQEYDTLKSQRDAAKAQYDLAVLQLGYASVSSPVAGTILAAPLSVGSVAAAPQPVAVVADLSDLVVRLDVPEKYFSLFAQNRHQLRAIVMRPESGAVVDSWYVWSHCVYNQKPFDQDDLYRNCRVGSLLQNVYWCSYSIGCPRRCSNGSCSDFCTETRNLSRKRQVYSGFTRYHDSIICWLSGLCILVSFSD